MYVYGGYICATGKGWKRYTYPIIFFAPSDGEAELSARSATYEKFPLDQEFSNHGWGILKAEGVIIKEETCS